MSTATGKVILSVQAIEVLNEGVKAGVIPSKVLENLDLRAGTSDGQIDLAFVATETGKAVSSTTTYDLRGGVNDSFGDSITFKEVCLILVRNKRTTNLAYLQVGPNSSDGFGTQVLNKGFFADASDRAVVGPEGWYVSYQPAGVSVDATHFNLDVSTSTIVGDINTWDILILGRSA